MQELLWSAEMGHPYGGDYGAIAGSVGFFNITLSGSSQRWGTLNYFEVDVVRPDGRTYLLDLTSDDNVLDFTSGALNQGWNIRLDLRYGVGEYTVRLFSRVGNSHFQNEWVINTRQGVMGEDEDFTVALGRRVREQDRFVSSPRMSVSTSLNVDFIEFTPMILGSADVFTYFTNIGSLRLATGVGEVNHMRYVFDLDEIGINSDGRHAVVRFPFLDRLGRNVPVRQDMNLTFAIRVLYDCGRNLPFANMAEENIEISITLQFVPPPSGRTLPGWAPPVIGISVLIVLGALWWGINWLIKYTSDRETVFISKRKAARVEIDNRNIERLRGEINKDLAQQKEWQFVASAASELFDELDKAGIAYTTDPEWHSEEYMPKPVEAEETEVEKPKKTRKKSAETGVEGEATKSASSKPRAKKPAIEESVVSGGEEPVKKPATRKPRAPKS